MFDSLIESSRARRSSQRLVTLPFVISLHVVVLLAIVIEKFLEVPEIQEPPIQVSFAQVVPPPPPPPPPPKAAAAKPEPSRPEIQPSKPDEVVQPVEAPKEMPSAESADAGGVEGGSTEGVEGGEIGGVPGGVLGGIPGEAPAPSGPLHIGGDVAAPVLQNRVQPTYPGAARSAHVKGVVILEAVIRKDGSVGDIRVVQGLGMGCTEAAIDAVRKWRYQPGTQNGNPVDVFMIVRVRFNLS